MLLGYLRHCQKKIDKEIEQVKKEKEQQNSFGLGKGAELDGYISAGYEKYNAKAKK